MDLTMNQVPKLQRRRQRVARQLRLNRRTLTLLLLVFALATMADTCTDPNTGEPIPHEHTPGPTPEPEDPGPAPSDRERSDDGDSATSKPAPGTYTVNLHSTEDGTEVLVERPPLCSTVTGDTPCIVSYRQDEEGNEVWELPPSEGGSSEDGVDSVYCGGLGDSLDHTSAPTPHYHPAPFPYDHDGNPQTPDICSHNSENCAWHGTCPNPQPPTTNPGVNQPASTPAPKVCTSSWPSATRQELIAQLRWESVVPYPTGFADYHHPEVPGGRLFLTAASTGAISAQHWIAQQPGSTFNVVDAEENGCLWTATAVGVSLRELLPYQSSDLAKLRSPGNVAAAGVAQKAASLWDRLSQQRKRWYEAAFPRSDPATTWCSPDELPPWTAPINAVLSLSSSWESSYGKCRWSIPRRGFWEWQLQVKYTSELGDHHTEVLAADLSWFREPTEYLGQQVTLW